MPRKRKGADLSRSTSKARKLRNSRSERTEEQIQQQNTDARVRMAQLHQEEPEDTRAKRNEVRRLERRQSRRFTVNRRRTNDQQRQQKAAQASANYRHFINGRIIEQGKEQVKRRKRSRKNAIPETSAMNAHETSAVGSAMEQSNVINLDDIEVNKEPGIDRCSVDNQHTVETPVDLASQLGKFGWQEIESTILPYLTRSNDLRVVSKRMADVNVIHEMEKHLSYEVLSCMDKNELEATAAEAKLLTDINKNHSDKRFGREPFKRGDPMILLSDLEEMVTFMRYGCVVYSKQPSVDGNRCGYMKIGLETVPYVLSDNKRYLPLFYFGGYIELLQKQAVKLDGWKLAYYRLLCKRQGVNEKYFEGRSMDCVELDHLKKFLPLGTMFEET